MLTASKVNSTTQPSTLHGTVKWVPAKGLWFSMAGSKDRYGLFAGNTVLPYLRGLENALAGLFEGALQMSRFTVLCLLERVTQ